MFLNLAYVPSDYVPSIFYLIAEKFRLDYAEAGELIEYFKLNYIGDKSLPSSYSISFWNCYSRVLKFIPRTINSIEAWHKSLNSLSSVAHVYLGKFIDLLRQINERNRMFIMQSRKK
ncbi:hypothetical protein DMUE_0438 [Dictyocoela muelleri]|nr:hypothetical protein DMUE_0438 [Dictyocoela muelleri]